MNNCVSYKKYCRRVSRELKRLYDSSQNGKKSESQKWIFDNFELLAHELKSAKKSIAEKRIKNDEKRIVFKKALELSGREALSTEIIIKAFSGCELSLFALMTIRDFLTLTLSGACSEASALGECERIAKSFSLFSSLSDIDFSAVTTELSVIYSELNSGLPDFSQMDEKSKALCVQRLSNVAQKLHMSEKAAVKKALECAEKNENGFYEFIGINKAHKTAGSVLLASKYILPACIGIAVSYFFDSSWLWLLLILPYYEIIRKFIYKIGARIIKPEAFLKKSLTDGIPGEAKTVIAYTVLLPKNGDFSEIFDAMQSIYATSCRGDKNVSVCALADFYSSQEKTEDGDFTVIARAGELIERLNSTCKENKFTCFIRERSFSASEDCFCGFDRKRGAVNDIVEYIENGKKSGITIIGDEKLLCGASYVFVADSDTRLSHDALKTLIATAVHPLYKAKIDSKTHRVTSGYGIFSPRVINDVSSSYATPFSRVMSGESGYSLYENGISEFYTDCFRNTVFQGKGLIDVKAYYSCMNEKLKPERVLSHDIVEGGYLRTALVSEAEISDSCPTSESGWFSRLDRWLRGDVQNLAVAFGKVAFVKPPILTKIMIADNVIRAAVPVAVAACIIASSFFTEYRAVLFISALLSLFLNPLIDCVVLLIFKPKKALRRYFSRLASPVGGTVLRAIYEASLLPQFAWTSLRAFFCAVRSMITGKQLLKWTVSADYSGDSDGVADIFAALPSVVFTLVLFISGGAFGFIVGGVSIVLYVASLLCISRTENCERGNEKLPTEQEKTELLNYAKSHFGYFTDYCTSDTGFLPPDNITFKNDGSICVNTKTSPTNIGFYLLSVFCAGRLGIIEECDAFKRLSAAFDTIEKMEKYHENLYNWYELKTLEPISPEFASSVDSGNFLCAITALKNGLATSMELNKDSQELIKRIDAILDNTDFSIFYNEVRGLLHTGIDTNDSKKTDSYYDLFMSEMRMTSFYAIASKSVPPVHWQKLMRKIKQKDGYFGAVSWTGTAFEYFMSCIFLPFYEGTDVYESLEYALYCQKKYAKEKGIPYGISESAYYEFDENGGYKYMADGVPGTALKKSVGGNFAVSPYSSFLFMCADRKGSIYNLSRLKADGGGCRYGFFDAVDYTKKRVSGKSEPVKTCMAHHIGMSFLAIFNELSDGGIRKWFMSDVSSSEFADLLKESI